MSNVIDLTVHQKKGTKPPPAASDHDVIVLDAAVAQVRAILQKFRAVEGRACAHMLDLGDVLIPVRRVAGYRAWGTFLRDCGLPKRDFRSLFSSQRHARRSRPRTRSALRV